MGLIKKMKPKLVKVKWIDTFSEECWVDIKGAKKWAKEDDGVCNTRGWLLEKNKKYIIIATTKDNIKGETMFHGLYCIPIYNVKKITGVNKKLSKK